jgi:hypothetical protein
MADEMFQSSVHPHGSVAAVFEYDGETGYFYLLDLSKSEDKQITAAIHIKSSDPDFSESDVRIQWNKSKNIVGLYLHGCLWAAFDLQANKYGGNYRPRSRPVIPADVASSF